MDALSVILIAVVALWIGYKFGHSDGHGDGVYEERWGHKRQ